VLRLKEPLTAAKDWPPNLRPMLAKYQRHKPKLLTIIDIELSSNQKLPWVVLAFGRFAVIPALGAIAEPEGGDGKLHLPDSKEAEAAMRQEFDWLIGLPAM
jgi:hypothetical protein